MYIVPLPVYALLWVVGLAEMPDEGTAWQFMISVLVVKIGVALGFVLLLRFAAGVFAARWLLYGTIWWLMFALVEIGQASGARGRRWQPRPRSRQSIRGHGADGGLPWAAGPAILQLS
jgi:hypothetical protein